MKTLLAVRQSAMMLFLSACLVFSISGQSQSAGLNKTAQEKVAKQDASQGISLNGTTDIQDNVEVQAVLLTLGPAEHIFGKEIAHNYAIVQVTISNQSSTSALVLQSVSLDYSKWLMNGLPVDAEDDCAKVKPALEKSFQKTCATRVGSVEARVIRGELQDAATWTPRNAVVRGLVLVGSVAAGYSFLGPRGFSQAVTGFNGNLVPGVQTFWPDQTLPQINRVSDFGFQTNKVIPKDNADIVYAFFPIERFLTPGLRRIFLAAPALFFAPFEVFVDKNIGSSGNCRLNKTGCIKQSTIDEFKDEMSKTVGIPTENPKDEASVMPSQILLSQCLAKAGACEIIFGRDPDSDPTKPPINDSQKAFRKYKLQALSLWNLLSSISLNKINVLVGGVMTVDVNTVPAVIKRVTFSKSNADAFSNACVIQSAVLEGQFLSNGVPLISQVDLPSDLASNSTFKGKAATDFVSSITTVPEQSNDLSIAFQLELKNPIPPKSVLHFNVTKYDQGDTKKVNPIKSADLLYTLDYSPAPSDSSFSTTSCKDRTAAAAKPKITGVSFSDKASAWATAGSELSGTIAGSNLSDGTVKVSTITLVDKTNPAAKDYGIDGDIKPKTGSTDTTLNFSLKPTKVIPAGTVLTFTVSSDKSDTANDSKDFTIPQADAAPTAAAKGKAAKGTLGQKKPVGAAAGQKKDSGIPIVGVKKAG